MAKVTYTVRVVRWVGVEVLTAALVLNCGGESQRIVSHGREPQNAQGAAGSPTKDELGMPGAGGTAGTSVGPPRPIEETVAGAGGSASSPPHEAAGSPSDGHAGSGIITAGGGGGDGYSGAAGAAGEMDTGVGASVCNPPSIGFELSEWQDPMTPATLDALVQRITQGMLGDWHGVVTTPWVAPYEVKLTFTADGGYSAACTWASNECCVAFYYGTDTDSDLKHYDVNRVSTSGEVGGDIAVIFGEPGSFYESGYQGTLENIELDATGTRLRFDFMYDRTYGPVAFDLERAGE
jgi:hypothetical protein